MHGMEDDGRAVGQGELVVADGQAAPLLQGVEASFDDVAAFVGVLVVGDQPSAGGTLAFPVSRLVVFLGDHALDAAVPQVFPVAPGGVGLVGHSPFRAFPLSSRTLDS